MFKVGDIVEINFHGDINSCMIDCPALNLKGTTAEIASVYREPGYFSDPEKNYYYYLSFINVVANKMDMYDKSQEAMKWKSEHLILLNKYVDFDITNNDLEEVFKDA